MGMAITAELLLVVETRCLIRALVGSVSFHPCIYAHIARMAAFGHHRAGTPELFSSVHCTDQDKPVHSFNCKHSSAFLEGHSGAIIISLSKLFHYLIKL